MRQFAAVSGRDPASLDTACSGTEWTRRENDGERMAFTGNVEAIIDDIGRHSEAGLNHLVIGFESDDVQQSLDRLDAFAGTIMPKV